MELTRKLISFVIDKNEDEKKYYISFAYYYDGKWTGTSERVKLTEEELYQLLKPALQIEIDSWHLKVTD